MRGASAARLAAKKIFSENANSAHRNDAVAARSSLMMALRANVVRARRAPQKSGEKTKQLQEKLKLEQERKRMTKLREYASKCSRHSGS
jgi:hypothetical protein